jgi:rhodanese-related sulfurtransferase
MFARRINDTKLLEKLVNEKGFAVIDTRSPVEYRDGTIFDAPNAPLRNFMATFVPTVRSNKKVVLIGSAKDNDAFQACIRYAEQNAPAEANIRYFYY